MVEAEIHLDDGWMVVPWHNYVFAKLLQKDGHLSAILAKNADGSVTECFKPTVTLTDGEKKLLIIQETSEFAVQLHLLGLCHTKKWKELEDYLLNTPDAEN